MDPDREDEDTETGWFVFQAAVEGSGPFYIRDLIVLLVVCGLLFLCLCRIHSSHRQSGGVSV